MDLTPGSESPLSAGKAHLRQYEDQKLDMKRTPIALDISKQIREVDIVDFIAALLPKPICDINAEAVARGLKNNYKEEWAYLNKRPKESKELENTFFGHIGKLFNAMIEEGGKVCEKESTLVYSSSPYNPVTTEGYPSTARPDGVFFKRGKNALNTHDVAFCAEYKKQNTKTDVEDNAKKIIYSMHNILRADPARRFVFGLTVADCEWTLWLVSRAALVKSTVFNPISVVHPKTHTRSNNTDLEDMHLKLTQIILSFAFAEETELGWDQTVARPEERNPLVYQFEVGKTKYTTVEELNMDGAYGLFGRGVRVYRVKDPEGTEAVLKDYWLTDDRSTERQIYNEIIADVKTNCPVEIVKMVERHLITPIDDCLVQVNGVEDNTKAIMHGSNIDLGKVIPWPGGGSVSSTDKLQRVPVQHKKHYRIVFKEFSRPISQITDYGNAFKVLADVLKVLKVMHSVGWVHRDISISNIYEHTYNEAVIGKLSDLEYAKKINDNSTHSARTGTIDFMSFEVIVQEYSYLPDTNLEPVFRHNALHDMEALWWCAVWILFFLRPVDVVEDDLAKERRLSKINYIFPGTSNDLGFQGGVRHQYTNTNGVDKALSNLSWSKLPKISGIIPILAAIRKSFVQAYMSFERLLIQNGAAPGTMPQTDALYRRMLSAFTDYGISCKGIEVVPSQVKAESKAHSLELEDRMNALHL